MGQKVHPIGFRLGVSKDWQAKWYAGKGYVDLIQEDLRIRQAINSKYGSDDISRVEIERSRNQVTVTVHTARPGIVIGRGGQRVDEMRQSLEKIAGKRVRLNIIEVAQPELDAYLVARSIAQQMERRISHRRAMKQAISRAVERGAQGIKITCAGRLSGSEYARKETLHQGRVPLHTLRADIDYAQAEAHTTLGRTGVKVWIYKGDVISEAEKQFLEGSLLTPVDERTKVEEVAPAGGETVTAEVAAPAPITADDLAEAEEQVQVAVSDTAEDMQAEAEGKPEETAQPEAVVPEKPQAKPKSKVKAQSEEITAAAEKPQPEGRAKAKAKVKEEAEAPSEPKAKAKGRAKAEGETGTVDKPKTKSTAKVKEKDAAADKPRARTKSKAKAEAGDDTADNTEVKNREKAESD